jgi:hypothetical protein
MVAPNRSHPPAHDGAEIQNQESMNAVLSAALAIIEFSTTKSGRRPSIRRPRCSNFIPLWPGPRKFINTSIQAIEAAEARLFHYGLSEMQKLVHQHRSVNPVETATPGEDEQVPAGSDYTAGSFTRENLGTAYEPVCVIFRQVEVARAL